MKNIVKGGLLMLTAALAWTSCSDKWDDHYDVQVQGEGTLWEAIEKDGSISNFKDVLKACGYDVTLNSGQVFTIFAPNNDCFTTAMRDSVIDLYKAQKAQGIKDKRNQAIKEFVKNHVALYNYPASSMTNDSITMMNGKYMAMTNTSFDKGSIVRGNVWATNGVLFTVSAVSIYQPNILEYLGRDHDLDSVAAYIYAYNEDYFYPDESVPGGLDANGKTVYLDSVTEQYNKMLYEWIGAALEDEDSTYWMLAPTNHVWDSLVTDYNKYFAYDAKVKGRDSLMFNYPRLAVLSGTTFSTTINPEKSRQDSMFSTLAVPYNDRERIWGSFDKKYYQFDDPFGENGIFADTKDVACSNGLVRKADHWNVDKTNTFMQEIVMEGESSLTLDSVFSYTSTSAPLYGHVGTANKLYKEISDHGMIIFSPKGSGQFQALLNVRNVMSNVPYDCYVVTVPSNVFDTLNNAVPCFFVAGFICHNEMGGEVWMNQEGNFSALLYDNGTLQADYGTLLEVESDASRVDSVYIGTYTFPTSSYGLQKPQVKLYLEGNVSNRQERNGIATKTIYIDCVVLKPRVK